MPAEGQGSEGMSCDLLSVTGYILHCCACLAGGTGTGTGGGGGGGGREVAKGKGGCIVETYPRLKDISESLGLPLPATALSPPSLIFILIQNLVATLQTRASLFDVGAGGGRGGAGVNTIKSMVVNRLNVSGLSGASMSEKSIRDSEANLRLAQRHLFMANNLFSIVAFLKEQTGTRAPTSAVTSGNTTSGVVKRTSAGSASASASGLPPSFNSPPFLAAMEDMDRTLTGCMASFCAVVAAVLGVRTEDVALVQDAEAKDRSGKYRATKAFLSVFFFMKEKKKYILRFFVFKNIYMFYF